MQFLYCTIVTAHAYLYVAVRKIDCMSVQIERRRDITCAGPEENALHAAGYDK